MPTAYESLTGRRRAMIAVFGAIFVLDVVAVVSSALELDLVNRAQSSAFVDDAELDANDLRQGIVGLAQLALYVTGAVVFIRWLRAAYRNADVVAPGLRRYGHGWAIGAWFVPFLNLWRPKQIVNDVWRAGSSASRPPVLLLTWWLSWIVAQALSQAAFQAASNQDTLEELKTVDLLAIVSDGWDAVVAVMAIAVVRQTTRRLDARAAAMAVEAALAAPGPDSGAVIWAPPQPPGGAWSPSAPERPAPPG